MSLRTLETGLFVVDHPFSVGGLHLGLRTTVARLDGRELVVHSPGPLTAGDVAEIRGLGDVVAIVGPNNLHHMFLPAAADLFPGAAVYGPSALVAKLGAERSAALGLRPLADWPAPELLTPLAIEGVPKLGETVFHHRASGTLILGDLAFNVRGSGSWFTRTFMKMNGAYDRIAPSRLFGTMVKDHAALGRSLTELFTWDFDRVTVCHGDVVERGGKAELFAGFASRLGPSFAPAEAR